MELKFEIVEIDFDEGSEIIKTIQKKIKLIGSENKVILRWGLIKKQDKKILLEVAVIDGCLEKRSISKAQNDSRFNPKQSGIHVAMVVPTGVGASVGGFIGDAGPVARVLEAVADSVIVHPNVVNAADFFSGGTRCLYVDGLTLDLFFEGKIHLGAPYHPKIGLLLDRLEPELKSKLLNAANGIRAALGAKMIGYVECKEKIRVSTSKTDFGHFVGKVENPGIIFQEAENLKKQGAEAIAVVTDIDGLSREDFISHYNGSGTNPVGAVEALISRSITWKTGLACAHAPACVKRLWESPDIVDPRAASEVASGTSLPCVLLGLAQTPKRLSDGGISVNDLSAILVPFECAGGPPALSAYQFGINLIAIKSNQCIVGVNADELNIPTLISVENYPEAIAYVACQKMGISWESLCGKINPLKKVRTSDFN